MSPAGICLVGAAGRMGRLLRAALVGHPHLRLASALVRTSVPEGLGPGVVVSHDPAAAVAAADVVVDFAAPPAAATALPTCVALGRPYLLAATGLAAADRAALVTASRQVAVLEAANLSLGVQAMLALVGQAAALLPSFDVEIAELHHRHKRDAPSGTAFALGAAVQAQRADLRARVGRQGAGLRAADELGYAALRGGDVVGEHTVYFLGEGERLEVRHTCTRGEVFARGALSAARWLLGRSPGLYNMAHVLAQPPA